ncbi:hypothetical protein FH972_013115 [Carpinus fangiana]|uniref:Uncharacterized protein n=1 Tax=Carpinus fangiana TaxID=176857 RepID=A0A5N6R8Z4_9ROSI|nr:hypothetical protein FH972_013115 [Carpinus fangiana]
MVSLTNPTPKTPNHPEPPFTKLPYSPLFPIYKSGLRDSLDLADRCFPHPHGPVDTAHPPHQTRPSHPPHQPSLPPQAPASPPPALLSSTTNFTVITTEATITTRDPPLQRVSTSTPPFRSPLPSDSPSTTAPSPPTVASLHKNASHHSNGGHHEGSYPSNRLNMRRSAMKNSLVRIGGVEGEWVKRALTALIRPSSHNLRRRADFQPTRSRLCIMSKAEDS